jgi:hypothetical protein
MSIARCVSKVMDRIAPLALAEKWDNVSPPRHFSPEPRAARILLPHPLLTAVRQVGLLLGPHA